MDLSWTVSYFSYGLAGLRAIKCAIINMSEWWTGGACNRCIKIVTVLHVRARKEVEATCCGLLLLAVLPVVFGQEQRSKAADCLSSRPEAPSLGFNCPSTL
jgi:hypothetical protein